MADTPLEKSDFNTESDVLRELPFSGTDPRFEPQELIACRSCSRSNPPNRTTCLYCGKPFETESIRTDLASVKYHRPEAWEDGFSLVYAGKGELSDDVIGRAAKLLQTSVEALRNILNVGVPIPLIYLRSLPDSRLLASQLSALTFNCAIVGDDLLQPALPPTRVRSIRFADEGAFLEDFNTSSVTQVRYQEKVLFVAGSLVKTSTELTGKISKGTLKAAEETLGFLDEPIIDIYPESDVYGFRVRSSGFDFSCLGKEMQRFAGANMTELICKFGVHFTSAIFIDSFYAAGPLISDTWPVDEIKQTSNITRGWLGGVHKQTVTVSDNTIQFTKFSRLQRHFI